MISPRKSRTLRRTAASELVSDYSGYTKGQFTHEGTPVLIAARNEELDLPATLISLADSATEVWPIVIENGSDDLTYEYAKAMGATVLHSDLSFKLAALQLGMKMLEADERAGAPVLFTDADTLVGRRWASTLERAVCSEGNNVACVATGSALIWDGPSRQVDAIRTIYAAGKDALSATLGREPVGRGHNMAVRLTNSEALGAYHSLDGRLFVAEEVAIMDAIKSTGGRTARSLGLSSMVLTRGDRIASIRECFSVGGDTSLQSRRELYREYEGIVPYVGS